MHVSDMAIAFEKQHTHTPLHRDGTLANAFGMVSGKLVQKENKMAKKDTITTTAIVSNDDKKWISYNYLYLRIYAARMV